MTWGCSLGVMPWGYNLRDVIVSTDRPCFHKLLKWLCKEARTQRGWSERHPGLYTWHKPMVVMFLGFLGYRDGSNGGHN